MFKYISSILAQMSPDQKFKSLVTLLVAISAIILVPYILDAISTTDEECQERVDRLNQRVQTQYNLIADFQTEIDGLNTRIQKQSNECTRKILQRDSYWTAQLIYIKSMVSKLERSDVMIYRKDTLEINPSTEDMEMKTKAIQNMNYLIYKNKKR